MLRTARFIAVPAAALLVASAGLAQTGAQPARPGQQQDQQRQFQGEERHGAAQQKWGRVDRAANIIGATVLDSSNENVGSVSDLIVDPMHGEIVYAIISHGGVLGIGAEHVAIPWRQLQHRPEQDRTYQISISKDRLEQAPSFEGDAWPLLQRPGWFDSTDKFFGATTRRPSDRGTGGWGMQGRLQKDWDRGTRTSISGNITKVERQAIGDDMADGLVVTIQTAEGEDRLIHLGPAWYLEGQLSELREGQKVQIEAREIPAEDRVIVLAELVKLDEGTLALRNQQGQPVWDAARRDSRGILAVPEDPDELDPADPMDQKRDQPQPGMRERDRDQPRPGMRDPNRDARRPGARVPPATVAQVTAFVRASDLRGSNVRNMDGTDIGTVNDLAVDTRTGRAPFIIAGFGGFIGIGETEVVLPWQALNFVTSEDRFMLAVDEEMLRTAPRLERDQLTRLEDPAFRQQVYSHFGMDASFAMYEHGPTPGMHERQPWGATGQLQKQFMQGQEVQIRGTVANVGRGEVMPGAAEAVFVSIRDRQDEEHIVKLGPAWFLQRQDLSVRPGEQIEIEGRKIDVEGRTLVLASTVRTTQAGLWLRDEQGRPRWDAFQQERHLGIEEQPDDKAPGLRDRNRPQRPGQPGQPGRPNQPERPGEPRSPGGA